MDSKLKRLTALLLCAAMTLVPLAAFGAGASEENVEVVYYPMVSREDYHVATLPLESQASLMSTENDFLLEAAAQLRAGMVAREPVIDVDVTVTDSSYNVNNLYNDLIKLAMAHTGVPNEGDYINGQWSYWTALSTSPTPSRKGNLTPSSSG